MTQEPLPRRLVYRCPYTSNEERTMMQRILAAFAAIVALALLAAPAGAQYPNKPVKVLAS